MYGYKHGIRSSRILEHAVKVNVELWWLLKGSKPSNRAISYFRTNNRKAFRNAFRHFVLILKEWELIDGEVIAIDSFKIRAQNSLKNNFNQKKISRQIKYIDERIDAYQKQLDDEDNEDKQQELRIKLDSQNQKKQNYQNLESTLKDSVETQISLTDPDAKAVILHRNIVNVGYNIQTACDQKNKLFVLADALGVNDSHALAPIALASKELLNPNSMNVLADKGYNTGEQLHTCHDHNIVTFVAPKQNPNANTDCIPVEKFQYNYNTDTYICPQGNVLKVELILIRFIKRSILFMS